MSRVLWVTDEVPDLELGGGSIRQYHLLLRLARRYPVDLVVVGVLRDRALRDALRSVRELPRPEPEPQWLQPVRARLGMVPGALPSEVAGAQGLVAALSRHLVGHESYDLVCVEHEWLARLVPPKRANRWVLTLQNLLSRRLEQTAADRRGLRRRAMAAQAGNARRLERWAVGRWDLTLVPSGEDAQALSASDRVAVVPNGVDLDRFVPSPLPADPVLLFCGLFAWPANADAASWCARQLLPQVRREVPGARLLLVGRAPGLAVRALTALEGVEGHFDVDDVVPFYRRSRVALVPLRVGSGTRLKALEAMAAGRPVAGTAVGLEGLGLEDGVSAAVAGTPGELAEKIVRLCREDAWAADLAARARAVAERFGWDAVADTHQRLLGLGPGD
jgi:glycosyltransferase involved in cell wall biosynthesis